MKLPIREVTYLGVCAIVFIFIIGTIFYTQIRGKEGMLSAAGEIYEAGKKEGTVSQNEERLTRVAGTETPKLRYVNRIYKSGEKFLVKELFEVKIAGANDFVSAVNEEGFSVSVQDIRDEKGNSLLADAWVDEEASEELASVIYDKGAGTICFHKSGIFTIRVLVWGENGRTVFGEIALPVETE